MNRVAWIAGSSSVALSVVENAWLAHKSKGMTDDRKQAINNARHIQMLNGIGMCLLPLRRSGKPFGAAALPFFGMVTGSLLFSGIIFYEELTKDKRFH